MEEISLARHFYFPWLLFKMQRLWGQTFPANIFPNEKCSRVRVSDRIYMVSVPHYSDFHRQNFNKSCFQRNYMRLMLFFCQFKSRVSCSSHPLWALSSLGRCRCRSLYSSAVLCPSGTFLLHQLKDLPGYNASRAGQ